MTDAVDITMIDGPRAGFTTCIARKALSPQYEVLTIDGMVNYTIVKRAINGKWYRFGVYEPGNPPSDAEVLAHGINPAWDLRDVPVPELN